MKLRLNLAAVAALGMFGMMRPAHAQTAAYDFSNTFANAYSGGNLNLGFEFAPTAAISVTSLGLFDSRQDGLVNDHAIGLWDTSGTLIASATVSSGVTDPLVGKFRYVSISPITLSAGTHYVIGASYPYSNNVPESSQDGFVLSANGFSPALTGFKTSKEITYITSRDDGGASLTFPALFGSALGVNGPGFFGPNFLFTPAASAVPEPGSVALLVGMAVVGAGVLRGRRRR